MTRIVWICSVRSINCPGPKHFGQRNERLQNDRAAERDQHGRRARARLVNGFNAKQRGKSKAPPGTEGRVYCGTRWLSRASPPRAAARLDGRRSVAGGFIPRRAMKPRPPETRGASLDAPARHRIAAASSPSQRALLFSRGIHSPAGQCKRAPRKCGARYIEHASQAQHPRRRQPVSTGVAR